MPSYQYEALDQNGSSVQGVVLAKTPERAQVELKEKGVYLTKIKEVTARQKKTNIPRQKQLFFRELAAYLNGGKTLDQSIELVWQSTQFVFLKTILADLKERVHRGESLAQAMKSHPGFFSSYDSAMVGAGEEAGQLAETFGLMAHYLEKQNELRSEIRSAVAYPVFVALFSFVTIFALFIFVIPTLESLYTDLGQALPWVTQALLSFSHFLKDISLLLALVLVGGLVWSSRPGVRAMLGEKFQNLLLKIPAVAEWTSLREGGRFCTTLSTLLQSGLGLLPALSMVQSLFQNKQYRTVLAEVRDQVEKGVSLSQALAPISLFPPILKSLIQAGEESGQLKEQLNYVGVYLEQESTRKLKTWVTFLEPVMIVGVGVVIGLVVLAVILPIVQINQMIS